MAGQKLAQIRLRRQEEDGQVAAVHDMASQPSRLFDQPSKIGIQFRCPAGDIDCWNIGLREGLDAKLSRVARHALDPLRSRINMTMLAGLVAELPDIDLKHGDPGCPQREET